MVDPTTAKPKKQKQEPKWPELKNLLDTSVFWKV
jgi:hypothetical protein